MLIAAVFFLHSHQQIEAQLLLLVFVFFSLFTFQIVSTLILPVWLDLDGYAYKTLAYVPTCTVLFQKCVVIFRIHKT